MNTFLSGSEKCSTMSSTIPNGHGDGNGPVIKRQKLAKAVSNAPNNSQTSRIFAPYRVGSVGLYTEGLH